MSLIKPNKIQSELILSSEDIQTLTQGEWINAEQESTIKAVRANPSRVVPGDLFFSVNPEQWGKALASTENNLEAVFAKGAGAAVVTNKASFNIKDKPILVVENTREAIEILAEETRKRFAGKVVMVTGTEGKTGCKFQLHHILNKQAQTHATLDSSNLDAPILSTLVSIKPSDKFAVVEASLAEPSVGVRRSNFIKPDICIITELGYEHLLLHGSMENMVKNKATAVTGLADDGLCIVKRDNPYCTRLREEIYKLKYVDIRYFGSNRKCNAQLLDAKFVNNNGWNIKARIEDTTVEYFLPLIEEHAPVASLAPLLTAYYLNLDVHKAAADFATFAPSETSGRLRNVKKADKTFWLYDQGQRGSILSFKSFFRTIQRMQPQGSGRKIVVISHFIDMKEVPESAVDLEEFSELISNVGIDRLYTVGEFKRYANIVRDESIWIKHGETYKDIAQDVMNDIQDNDMVFIKGVLAQKLYELVKLIEAGN